jgi:hypothetical protein
MFQILGTVSRFENVPLTHQKFGQTGDGERMLLHPEDDSNGTFDGHPDCLVVHGTHVNVLEFGEYGTNMRGQECILDGPAHLFSNPSDGMWMLVWIPRSSCHVFGHGYL